jgi:coenzyme PQQ synthesis protein D (PqqD)
MLQNPNNNLDSRSETGGARIFVRTDSVVSRRVAGETLIVPVRGKVGDLASIYSFNEVGSLIWQLLEIPRDVSELVSAVEREYDVDPPQAQHDVSKFLNDMLSVGLVEVPEAMHTAGAKRLKGAGRSCYLRSGDEVAQLFRQ